MKRAKCPICSHKIGAGKWSGHENVKDGPHIHMFEALCPECHVKLSRKIAGRNDSGWTLPAVDISSIKEYLDNEEITVVSKRLSRYPALFARWNKEFLEVHRPGDRVGRYVSKYNQKTALAVVRDHVVVATFAAFSNL